MGKTRYIDASTHSNPKTGTSRLLAPSIVLATLCILVLSGGAGMAVAVLTFLDPLSANFGAVCVGMGFVASAVSLPYR